MAVTLVLLDESDSRGRPLWQLQDDYHYSLGPGSTITVPAGYISNLGTIPRWARFIVLPAEMRTASILHDYLCNEKLTEQEWHSGYSRCVADAILFEALMRQGMKYWKAKLIYCGVRCWAVLTRQDQLTDRPVVQLRVEKPE